MQWIRLLLITMVCGTASPLFAQTLPAPEEVLPQLMFRNHHKPYDLLFTDGRYAQERTIYRDPLSHTEVWKLTHDPGMTLRPYYDIPCWNADGSCMRLEAWRNNCHVAYTMDSDGGNLRPLDIPGRDASRMVGIYSLYWSCQDPQKIFFAESRDGKTWVMAYYKDRHQVEEITWYMGEGYRLLPPHPKEEVFLLTRTGKDVEDGNEAVLAFLDPSKNRTVPIHRKSFHRLRFTKGDDCSVFFNTNDKPKATYLIHADGTNLTTLWGTRPEDGNSHGQHPDFSHDGRLFSAVDKDGYIQIRDRKGNLLKTLAETHKSAHGGFAYGNRYLVFEQTASSTPKDSPHEGEVIMLSYDDSPKIWSVAKHYTFHASRARDGHPYTESTHVNASASFDLTKIGYNSLMCGAFPDIFTAVVMYPDPPRHVAVRRSGSTAELSWELPAKHTETKGFNIYRSTTSGRGYERINRDIIIDRHYRDSGLRTDQSYYYVVAAQEHSGLQGRPSAEVCASSGGNWTGPAVVHGEVELGACDKNMFDDLDGRFSNNCFVKLRPCRGDNAVGDGTVTVTVEVPKTSEYTLYTLTRTVVDKTDYWVKIDDQPEDLIPYDKHLPAHAARFSWTPAPRTYQLSQGAHTIRYRVNSEMVMLDKLVLSDDPAYTPDGDGRLDADPPDVPRNGRVETLGLWTLGLHWDAVRDNDLRYYNVYCSQQPDFPCDQEHLVLSPSAPTVIDWGLQTSQYYYTGTTYYYRITAVDFCGNESGPSPVIKGRIGQPNGQPSALDY